jgi:hypothetical protein
MIALGKDVQMGRHQSDVCRSMIFDDDQKGAWLADRLSGAHGHYIEQIVVSCDVHSERQIWI